MAPKPPASLVRYLREGRCVLFCGSGLSAWAKLPTWTKLLEGIVKQLSDELPDETDTTELTRLLQAGKLLEVADHCKESLGRRYSEILSDNLRGATGDIPEPHKVIVQLPFSAVVTTNYDKLLERSYSSVGNWPKTPTHRDVDALGPMLFDRCFFILKAHGDIDRPESMVLTTRDYQEIIHANPAFNAIFSAILMTKAVLFVGYSINDPDFRLLLDRQLTIFKGNIPERYALMCGVGRVEREVLWRTARIRVLSYDDGKHEQVLDFLRDLLQQVGGEASATPVQAGAEGRATRSALRGATAIATGAAEATAVLTRVSGAVRAIPTPDATLAIRLRAGGLEVSVKVDDTTVEGTGKMPDWAGLASRLRRAVSGDASTLPVSEELTSYLPRPVCDVLERIDASRMITLRLSPEVELLPWEWVLINRVPLVLRNPVARTPIGVSDNARGYPSIGQPPRVLLIGDPNRDDDAALPGARAETEAVAAAYRRRAAIDPTILVGPDASFDRLVTEFSSTQYDVVHFAGHAWFDELEPYLLLSGESKLRSGELRSLMSPRPPAILFLNSHFTIFTPPGAAAGPRHGAEEAKPNVRGQRGFIEAASTAGVGALIGCFAGALDDTTARDVGITFHESLISGAPVAKALHVAVAAAPSNASRLSYAISGYGDIALPTVAGPPSLANPEPRKRTMRSG